MKKINAILILCLCLFLVVLPVLAAKDGPDIHAGSTAAAAENNGQSHGEKGGAGPADDNRTPAAPLQKITGDDQRNEHANNNTNPADVQRNVSRISGLENQSGREHGADQRNASTVPPGWEKNPNQVRDAVHALLAMENRTGGIGPRVSAIAREFNNSANESERYRDRINNRDALSRFFFGGDRQAADDLANLTAQNQARIGEIGNLMNSTTLDADTRSRMDDELRILQQNVASDQQLAAQAKQDRGLFGLFG